MNKLILASCFLIAASVFTFGQSKDYKKYEFFGGYSNGQVDTGADSGNDIRSFFNDRRSFDGFEASGVYNIHRYFGIKGDFSGTYRNQTVNTTIFTGPSTPTSVRFDTNRSLYNLLGGIQVKDNTSDSRIKPFAHALIGLGSESFKVKNCSSATTPCPIFVGSSTYRGVAGAIGGGLDVKLNDKIDIRAIQVDYNPMRFNGEVENNVRFGVGIVFK